MDYICHPDDAKVIRNIENKPGAALMIDEEGDTLFVAPDFWTDDQMFTALNIMNGAYSQGIKTGKRLKQIEICKALGIDS